MSLSDKTLNYFLKDEAEHLTPEERSTFFLDSFRIGVDGIIQQTLAASIFLMIGISYFGINDFWKSLISSSVFIGMMLALFTSSWLSHHNPSRVTGTATIAGGLLLMASGLTGSTPAYGLTIIGFSICIQIRTPLFTAIYAENYNQSRRGKLFGAGILLSLVTGLASSTLFGYFLEREISSFRWIYIFCGALLIYTGVLLFRIPFNPGRPVPRTSPLKNLGLLWKYPVFGQVSLSWFLLGFANLWSLPLRTVYLVERERGLGLSPLAVLIILGVIPTAVKFIFTNFWARIFDRFSFIPIRIINSLLAGGGIFIFFLTDSIPVVILGQVIMNIGFGASPFLWNLWVTRVAPPGESQPFMSVHTFLCGVRGTIGPFIGFAFIQSFSMQTVGALSLGITLLSILILMPLLKQSPETWSRPRMVR
ncbi:MAG: MFS transporter [Spirochaetales bacterium]|nr:MFS transporter [Spirochaetales bacterium]